MIKIQFWLKNNPVDEGSLQYITIANPKIDKTEKFARGNCYVCEVYLSNIKKTFPYYGINPIDTLFLASKLVKIHLQSFIKNGFVISEVESKEPWKLEKLSKNFLQEQINKVKNNPNISREEKYKILTIIKDSFGNTVIKNQLDQLIK